MKVAYLADGINVNDPDFIRANGKHVFVDYKDFSGTGTGGTSTGGEAFLDSSSIAAQGREVYNVQSVTIPVTITPAGKAGTVVSGTLYVADSSFFSTAPLGGAGGLPLGSDVAAFPYRYTIGA